MNDFNLSNIDKEKANLLNPLVLAYIGDAVYEIYVRTKVVNDGICNTNVLHHKATTYVKAKAQADILESIYEDLTDGEKEIVRRGRNVKSNTIPKNAEVLDYKKATALEALIGYLFLTEQINRLKEIIEWVLN